MQGRENQKKGRKEEINRGKVDRKRESKERYERKRESE